MEAAHKKLLACADPGALPSGREGASLERGNMQRGNDQHDSPTTTPGVAGNTGDTFQADLNEHLQGLLGALPEEQ